MTSSRTRLGVLSVVFVSCLAVVLLHLWLLMVQNGEVWARRSFENRWAFRSVPSQRGSLRDRDGVVLARDVATTRVSVYYHRFRLRHVIGAAVHGATHWASLIKARAGTTYTYLPGVLGPRVAAEDLLNVPVRALQPGILSKSQFADLVTYATTVLSVCSGETRAKSFAAMREAALRGDDIGIGDVLPLPRIELLRRFQERLDELRRLDRLLAAEQQKHAEHMGRTTVRPSLIATLEVLRRQSLDDVHSTWTDDEGVVHEGSAKEDIRRFFANDVAFELAAALRVDRAAHPGLGVEPAVRRERYGSRDTSLGVILGEVRSHDRLIPPKEPPPEGSTQKAKPSPTWVSQYLDSEMDDDWLAELVPANVVASAYALKKMRAEAERRYQRDMHVFERRGKNGMESLCNDELMGVLGMRFVEHDSRRREQLLWSHLRVQSGKDVQITIDLEVQEAAEVAVRNADARYRASYTEKKDLDRLEAALAVIDAHTGDVLAVAGAPIRDTGELRVPGFSWSANGAIGSVVKPFVLLEHLESQRFGRPHRTADQIRACDKYFSYGTRRIGCDGTHWEAGRDPVTALAESCNLFFYQIGIGLGNEGVGRALKRFGLMPADSGDPFEACWQARVRGLPVAKATVNTRRILPTRSIGYGIQAAPLLVARAYAGIATGILPTVGLRLGEARLQVPLGDLGESLATVRQGLKECVDRGTARRLDRLQALGVHAKTGTAEVTGDHQNNGWFAGYLPWTGRGGMQLAFCAVVYRVPNGVHGGDAAGTLVVDFLQQLEANPQLKDRYLTR